MFRDDTSPARDRSGRSTINDGSSKDYDSGLVNDLSHISNARGSHKLPPGTGPGTSGKPASEKVMEHDLERSRNQGTAGHGTDAAAAYGGSLQATHQSAAPTDHTHAARPKKPASETDLQRRGKAIDTAQVPVTRPHTADVSIGNRTADHSKKTIPLKGNGKSLDSPHPLSHSQISNTDSMPSGDTQEDTNQLNPITHETLREIETEEVERVKDYERHVHHVQHHIQPVIAHEELVEQQKHQTYPTTRINEVYANNREDNKLFDGQIRQQRDTLDRPAKERTVIDKGTTVNEQVHHHIHHVIQPIIEKETVDRCRIYTTIPIHEVAHEAPVIHQSQTHAPVAMDHFLQCGGILSGAITQDNIRAKVMNDGGHTREVDGIAETLTRDLGLHDTSNVTSGPPSHKTRDSADATTRAHDTGVLRTAHQPVDTVQRSYSTEHPIPVATG
ncbi:hypothetical protein BDQ12DRAFT_670668 [Crucibulum laeve]|uniref:Allergen n=1 Tax=Crucibulum laeve TaxID=68775 RepID=A0A5C3LJM3_9AGAR|nr:hypothetical protein BDQ12DRAFT_670668 [Crucibulum laeve]